MTNKVKFGLKDIPKNTKHKVVSDVFTSVANEYDLMNDLMSLGLHRIWKEKFCKMAKVTNNDNLLDIASGTGDLVIRFLRKNPNITVTCLDENQSMLEKCKDKLLDSGFLEKIYFTNSSIEKFKDQDNKYSLATIAFGFRNFTDHRLALKNIYKSLQPGGRLLIMDFKAPDNPIMEKSFFLYTDKVLPLLGKKVVGDSDSYQYLSDSIKSYMKMDEISSLLKETNFIKIRSESLFGDFVSIHVGYKS